MHRLRHRLTHDPGGAERAVEPRIIAHLENRRDAASLIAQPECPRAGELDFRAGVGAVAELVLEALQAERIERAVGREARQEEAGHAAGCLGRDQESVAHRRRQEPFVADQPVLAVAAGQRRGARRIGAHIRPALLLGEAHADQRAGLGGERREAAVVAAREDARQPCRGESGIAAQRGHRSVGHGDRAERAAFHLGHEDELGGARHMGAGPGIGPGPRMHALLAQHVEQRVPGGVELDLVAAVTEAVEESQLRRMGIGEEAQFDGRRVAAARPQCRQLGHRPRRALARDTLRQGGIGGEQIIAGERRRLVEDLVGGERLGVHVRLVLVLGGRRGHRDAATASC